MIVANQGSSSTVFTVWMGIALFLLIAQVSPAAEKMNFDNGITATIHAADEISAGLILNKDGSRELIHPAAGSLTLLGSDAGWVPFDEVAVVNALSSMQGFQSRMDVEVFLLPAPPAEIGSSFARRGAIFLSPGTGPVPEVTIAYITTHEMGHVLTWAFLDDRPARWDAYLEIRGLDESNLSSDAIHADRAREILAEDIRFLFGGSLATRSGTIENHDLIEPDLVFGLSKLLAGYFEADFVGQLPVVSRAYPNPCNPLTTIEMALDSQYVDEGDSAVLRLYNIRGALVRTIAGGYVANGRVAIQWNGSDDSGRVVASGRYLYVIQAGPVVTKGSVTVVR